MEPYKAKKMPLEYKIDKELLKLIAEANVKYGDIIPLIGCNHLTRISPPANSSCLISYFG